MIALVGVACNQPESDGVPTPPAGNGADRDAGDPPDLAADRAFVEGRMARLDQLAVAYEERLLAQPPDLPKTRGYLAEAASILDEIARRPPFPAGETRTEFVALAQEGARDLRDRARRPPTRAEMDLAAFLSYLQPIQRTLEGR